ncbi:expressed unknown protein [Seminavis robusta]|uniref:Uncharacterized protein n=1 Tax=Seminavis robusta TaxID=568900 RepID=A0A9N8HYC1_9STRA|nr:expressed unknown protein [Seminavis robusta]|eukprot:Sro2791_g337190.1 n/a (214) ;mRNA; f:5368-6009
MMTASNMSEPLIKGDNTNSSKSASDSSNSSLAELDHVMIGRLKYSCLILGVLIGFFIQVSTIGASFLTNLPWAKGTSDQHIAVYALVWSIITATASCGVMMIFRSFVEITFNLTFGRALAYDPIKHDQILDELVWYFECYFSLGVLISVTLAWVATSFVLGMPTTLIDLGITIALPVFWCFSFFVIFMTKDSPKSTPPKKEVSSREVAGVSIV